MYIKYAAFFPAFVHFNPDRALFCYDWSIFLHILPSSGIDLSTLPAQMIELLIFHLHILAALYAFSARWAISSIKEALLGPVVVGLVFAIGWSLTSALSSLITPDGGFAPWLTADTISLLILVVPEFFVFRMLFWGRDRPSLTARTAAE